MPNENLDNENTIALQKKWKIIHYIAIIILIMIYLFDCLRKGNNSLYYLFLFLGISIIIIYFNQDRKKVWMWIYIILYILYTIRLITRGNGQWKRVLLPKQTNQIVILILVHLLWILFNKWIPNIESSDESEEPEETDIITQKESNKQGLKVALIILTIIYVVSVLICWYTNCDYGNEIKYIGFPILLILYLIYKTEPKVEDTSIEIINNRCIIKKNLPYKKAVNNLNWKLLLFPLIYFIICGVSGFLSNSNSKLLYTFINFIIWGIGYIIFKKYTNRIEPPRHNQYPQPTWYWIILIILILGIYFIESITKSLPFRNKDLYPHLFYIVILCSTIFVQLPLNIQKYFDLSPNMANSRKMVLWAFFVCIIFTWIATWYNSNEKLTLNYYPNPKIFNFVLVALIIYLTIWSAYQESRKYHNPNLDSLNNNFVKIYNFFWDSSTIKFNNFYLDEENSEEPQCYRIGVINNIPDIEQYNEIIAYSGYNRTNGTDNLQNIKENTHWYNIRPRSNGNGTDLSVNVTINANHKIGLISITNAGNGYINGDILVIRGESLVDSSEEGFNSTLERGEFTLTLTEENIKQITEGKGILYSTCADDKEYDISYLMFVLPKGGEGAKEYGPIFEKHDTNNEIIDRYQFVICKENGEILTEPYTFSNYKTEIISKKEFLLFNPISDEANHKGDDKPISTTNTINRDFHFRISGKYYTNTADNCLDANKNSGVGFLTFNTEERTYGLKVSGLNDNLLYENLNNKKYSFNGTRDSEVSDSINSNGEYPSHTNLTDTRSKWYYNIPAITVNEGGGDGAVFSFNINANGNIESYKIVRGGNGYSLGDIIKFNEKDIIADQGKIGYISFEIGPEHLLCFNELKQQHYKEQCLTRDTNRYFQKILTFYGYVLLSYFIYRWLPKGNLIEMNRTTLIFIIFIYVWAAMGHKYGLSGVAYCAISFIVLLFLMLYFSPKIDFFWRFVFFVIIVSIIGGLVNKFYWGNVVLLYDEDYPTSKSIFHPLKPFGYPTDKDVYIFKEPDDKLISNFTSSLYVLCLFIFVIRFLVLFIGYQVPANKIRKRKAIKPRRR